MSNELFYKGKLPEQFVTSYRMQSQSRSPGRSLERPLSAGGHFRALQYEPQSKCLTKTNNSNVKNVSQIRLGDDEGVVRTFAEHL